MSDTKPPKYPLVRFVIPGLDEDELLPVSSICIFARGPRGNCAFCDGDPCNQRSAPDSPIARFYAKCPRAATCPICGGRPS